MTDDALHLNVLGAYPYMKDSERCSVRHRDAISRHAGHVRFLLDSGAFTAWKSGKPISLDDYCKFLETSKFPIWRYFALDVIGDPAATARNLDTMLARGLKPIPVFTRGEDPKRLDELYKVSDVVGIGGLVGTRGNTGFVKGVMKHVAGRRVHWLGFTRRSFLCYYRPYMCDATDVLSSALFGTIKLYVGNGRHEKITRGQMRERPSRPVMDAMRRLGFEPSHFAREKNWRGGEAAAVYLSAASAVSHSRDVQKMLGTKLFLASMGGDPRYFEIVLEEHERMYV